MIVRFGLEEDTVCRNCLEQYETNEHFWNCTAHDHDLMYEAAVQKFESAMNKLKHPINLGNYTPQQLIDAIRTTNPLKTKCAITTEQRRMFKELYKNQTTNVEIATSTADKNLTFTMHCIFYAVFEILWKARNDKTVKSFRNREVHRIAIPKPPPKRKSEIQKARKRKRIEERIQDGMQRLVKRFRESITAPDPINNFRG